MNCTVRLGLCAMIAGAAASGMASAAAEPNGVIDCGTVTMPSGNIAKALFVRASEGPSGQWNCDYATRTALDGFKQTMAQEAGGVSIGDVECMSGPDQYGPFAASSYFFTCTDPMGSGVGLRTP
ncbi:MAG: hypothetical protein QOC76_5060 [Mycobacterium sp.]|jgi:hypothetical protein|nr:hypothetical protein [Mycobacterium sp.]